MLAAADPDLVLEAAGGRPERRRLLACMCLLALALAGCTPRTAETVVVVVVDTLRQDGLGVYGYERPTSPHLDRFAEEALIYANAYSQAPWTTPSVSCLLTGRYPSELGISRTPHGLGESPRLLSEILRDEGWWTGAVVSHYFLSRQWKLDQGFSEFDESNVKGHAVVTGHEVTDRALEMLRERSGGRAFLFVHYFDPHYDYLDHAEGSFAEEAYRGPVRSGMVYTDLLEIQKELEPRDLEHLRDLYDSEIAFTDRQIGRLLDGLREMGRFEDALIVVTADHGEEFLERRTIGHGATLFEEVLKGPLLVKLPHHPRQARGVVRNTPVGLVDVAPTILDSLGLPAPPEISGRSLLAEGIGAEPPARPVFGETDRGRGKRSVLVGNLKLIRHVPTGRDSLYDLASDPEERFDLLSGQADPTLQRDAQRLRRELNRWLKTMEHARDAHTVELTQEDRAALRAIGYLE
jgi:arylsulfatase A-like enzyme